MDLIREVSVKAERGFVQLFTFFALILFAPLPLASNRTWSLALLGELVLVLLFCSLWNDRRRFAVWQNAKRPLVLLGFWVGLLCMQLLPVAFDYYAATDFQTRGEISIDSYSTKLYLAKACILGVFFWLTLVLIDSRRRIEWLAKVIVLSGLIQALAGVVMMASGATFQLFFVPMDDTRAHGTFASPDHFAGYLELTLAVGIGLMIAKLDGRSVTHWRKRLHGWLALLISGKAMLRLALIIMVVGLVASRSRMGNAAFFSSLLIVGLVTVIFAKHAARTTLMFITSLIILDVVIIGGVVGVEKVVQRIQNTNLETQANEKAVIPVVANPAIPVTRILSQEESVEQRTLAARSSVQLIRDFPWFGLGGGVFQWAFSPYQPPKLFGLWEHAHNDFVEIVSEAGITGFVLLLLLVLDSVRCSFVMLINSRDQLSRGMAFASLMGMIALLIHGVVDFNFQITANAMLFIIVMSFPYLLRGARQSGG